MASDSTTLEIIKGSTFSRVFRWGTSPFIYKPITAITKAGPAVITATGHGVPDGWRVAVVNVGGMRQIKAKNWPPRSTDFHAATVVNANSVSLNDVDSTNFTAFTSGGSLLYYTPASLSGLSARLQIRDTPESATTRVSLVSPTDIVLDDTAKTITVTIAAAVTAAFEFTSGVYDLEIVSGSVVTKLIPLAEVIVSEEVTQ